MRIHILILSLSILFLNMNIFANDSAFGYWLTSASIVKIENCDNSLCATIQIVFVPEGVDPESVLDKNNRNKDLRSRTLMGLNLLEDFSVTDQMQTSFEGGKIYDPNSGRSYKSKIFLKENGDLRVEGCLAFVCDGEDWKALQVTISDDGSKHAVLKNASQKN